MEVLKIERKEKRQFAEVFYNNKKYCVSDNGKETLIFEYNKDGSLNYLEVGGGRNISLDIVLSSFESYLFSF